MRRLVALLWLMVAPASAQQQPPSLDELRATAEAMPDMPAAQSNYGAGLKAQGRVPEGVCTEGNW